MNLGDRVELKDQLPGSRFHEATGTYVGMHPSSDVLAVVVMDDQALHDRNDGADGHVALAIPSTGPNCCLFTPDGLRVMPYVIQEMELL